MKTQSIWIPRSLQGTVTGLALWCGAVVEWPGGGSLRQEGASLYTHCPREEGVDCGVRHRVELGGCAAPLDNTDTAPWL